MRKSFLIALGLALALAAFSPLCVKYLPTSIEDVLDTTDSGRAETLRDADALAWPPKRLHPRRPPTARGAVAIDARRVVFLPMLNRSRKRVHINYLRSVSETLGAHASIFLGRRVVSPELVDAILKAEGQSDWFGVPNHFRYSETLLERVHALTNAGVVVWAEYREDGQIRLDAKGFTSEADPRPWQEITLGAQEDLDRFVYDAPRALLAQIVDLGRIPPFGGSGDSTNHDDMTAEVEAALSLFWEGEPGSLIQSEWALARLAAQAPHDPEPWVQLAFVRAVRPLLFRPDPFDALMNEGANPARHIAHLLSRLTEDQRARIAFVDHLYTGHRQSAAEFDSMIDSLPVDAPERALLAWFHRKQDPVRFGAADAKMEGVLGQVLAELAPLPGPTARQTRAAEHLTRPDPAILKTPVLLLTARSHFEAEDEWSNTAATWMLSAAFGATEATTALRETCFLLPDDSRTECFGILEAFMVQYVPELEISAGSLIDDGRWHDALRKFAAATLRPAVPSLPTHPVPEEVLATNSEVFPGLWYLSHQILQIANEIFSIGDTIPIEGVDARELLASRPRNQVFEGLDTLLAAAYQPAVIGRKRAQPDEYRSYHMLLRDVCQQDELESAFTLREGFDRRLRIPTSHALDLMSFTSRHPYRVSYLDDHFKKVDSSALESLSDWLIELVPLPPSVLARALRIRIDANNESEISARLEREIERRPNDELARALEISYFLRSIDKPKRLSVLDAAVDEFPFNEELRSRAAWVAIYAKRLDLAEERFTAMLESGSDLKDACRGLAQIARRHDEMDHAEQILLSCVNRSTSQWDRHSLLIDIANIRRDQDRFQESQAAVELARKQVGGSGAVLAGSAENFELAGEYDVAARLWKQSWDAYKKAGSWNSALSLARLELRRGDTDRALEIFNELFSDTRRHTRELLALGKEIYLARDDVEGFRSVCARAGANGWVPLAEFEWDEFHDRDAAFKALDEAEGVLQPWAIVPTLRGKILLESGEPGKALAEFRRAQEIDGIMWTYMLIPQAQLAAGEIDAVRQTVRDKIRLEPWEVATWNFRARLEIHEGKLGAARRSIDWAIRRLPKPGDDGLDGWWQSIRPLLLMDAELMEKAGGRPENLALEARLTQITNRFPVDTDLLVALARVRDKLGLEKKAAESWSLLAAIRPRHPALPGRVAIPAAKQVQI